MTAQQELEKLKIENALLTKLLLQQQSQTRSSVKPIPFIEAYRRWLQSRKSKIQSGTFFEYTRVFQTYIIPYWQPKELMIGEITPTDINDYYDYLKATYGMSNNTLIRHHANLHSCFHFAYKKDWIPSMIIDKIDRPAPDPEKPPNYYTIDEIIEALELAKGTRIYLPALLASILGLSRSELLGIKWDAINFNAGTITVMRKMTRDKAAHKDVVSRNLKTAARARTLVLPRFLLDYLQEVKKRTASLPSLRYADYICVDDDGTMPTLSAITDRWRRFVQRQGLKRIRLHDLRHSCASMLLSLGYSMKDIQEWLGHSNYQTTANIYAHVDVRDKERIARRLQQVIGSQLYALPVLPDKLSESADDGRLTA